MRETININTRQCNKYYNRSNHRMLREHRLKTLLLEYHHKCIVLKLTYELLCKNIFQVLLKQDNTTQLVQDDQIKGPLRVCMFYI